MRDRRQSSLDAEEFTEAMKEMRRLKERTKPIFKVSNVRRELTHEPTSWYNRATDTVLVEQSRS